MSILILDAGTQTSIQAGPRNGTRHFGVPWSGPADCLSHALANRSVGNDVFAPALEITCGTFMATAQQPCTIALVGAPAPLFLNDQPALANRPLIIAAGTTIKCQGSLIGMRSYMAIRGGVMAKEFLASGSTYMPAKLGGIDGCALKQGSIIPLTDKYKQSVPVPLPDALIPFMTTQWMLRCTPSAETNWLKAASEQDLFSRAFTASHRASRMGVALEGKRLKMTSSGTMPSTAVFPGTVQCPEGGTPFILLADAQTTGGYPRIAHVARCDRHRLGQIRPGDTVAFQKISSHEAIETLIKKEDALTPWLGGFSLY